VNVTTQEAKPTSRWLTFRRAIAAAFTASLAVAGLLPLLGAQAAGAATSITGLTGPNANPATAGATSNWTFTFATSATGALASGTGKITIAGPAGTVFPSAPADYTVNANSQGAIAASTVAVSNGGSTATVTTPTAVGNTTTVQVIITGVKNPPSGTYSVGVSTSSDTSVVTTSSFTISSSVTAVTGPSPSNAAENVAATYTIGFTTSQYGALTPGASKITIQAPMALPTALGNYFVNGYAVTANPAGATFNGVANAQQTITVPAAMPPVGPNAQVTVVIEDVTNPATAGNYTISISTSSDTSPSATPSFLIGTAVSAVGNTPSTTAAGASNVVWAVTFKTSATGALTAGTDTITITAPAGSVLPTTSASYVVSETVNNTSVAATAAPNVSGTTATITVPAGSNISSSDTVTVTINGVTNPSVVTPANTILVNTSKDVAPAAGTFATQTAVSGATVQLTNTSASSAAVTLTSNYTVTFTAKTAVTPTQFVYLCAPSNAGQYTGGNVLSTAAANYTIAAGGGPAVAIATAASQAGGAGNPCPANNTGVKLTVPNNLNNGLGIQPGQSVTVVLANQNNPTTAGNYQFIVDTTGDPAYTYTNAFTIAAQATSTVYNVGVTPDNGGSGEWLIGFQTPAAISAGGTITVTFPTGAPIDNTLGDWSIGAGATPALAVGAEAACAANGTTCTAIATPGAQQVQWTVAGANYTAGAFVAIQNTSGAAGDPPAGDYTVTVSTSASPTAVSSGWFVVDGPTATLNQPTATITPTTANNPEILVVNDSAGSTGAITGACAAAGCSFQQPTTVKLTSTSNDGANPFPNTASDYVINGIQAGSVTQGGVQGAWTITVNFPAGLVVSAGQPFSISVAGYSESTAGTYTVNIVDTQQPTPGPNTTFTLANAATQLAGVSGPGNSAANIPNPNTAGASSLYTIALTTSATGALTPGSSMISVVAPIGSVLPTSASAYTVAGITASTVVMANNNTQATITVPASVPPASVGNSSTFNVTVNGVTNPSSPSANYSITAWTSADTLPKASGTYTIAAGVSNVTGLEPDLASAGGGATRVYTVIFKTSPYGALDSGTANKTITVTAAPGTTFTSTAGDYVVNGVAANSAVPAAAGGSATNNQVVITVNNTGQTTIPANSWVYVSISNVTNPSAAGANLQWTVATQADASPVAGPAFAITTTLTVGNVTLSNNVAQTPSNYTLPITPATSLVGGVDSITVIFPAGTVLPSSNASYVVNNITASSVNVTGTTVQINLAQNDSLTAGTAYNVVVNGVTNPNPGTSYELVAYTSQDKTPVNSAAYTIVAPPAPVVTSISPNTGPTAGGTSVTITGTSFTATSTVNFGAVPATSVTFNSSTSITAVSPAQAAGVVNVVVNTIGGTSATSSADQFTYTAPVPTVTAISPTSGPTTGGTSVTITGTGLTAATAVDFGTVASPSITANSDTSITAVSPAESAGTVDVTVTTAGGTSATSAADKFTFATCAGTLPTVTAVSPSSGPAAGGTAVTITGTNFESTGTPPTCVATAVNFGTAAATNVTVVSPTQITATSPAGSGTVDVTVVTPGGTSATSSADQFTYQSAVAQGYFLVQSTGKVSAYGNANSTLGDNSGVVGKAPTVGLAVTPSGNGYWELDSDGGIFTYGDAAFYGSAVQYHPVAPIIAIAPTMDGKGYWELGSDGGIFSFGDALYYGSTYQLNPNLPAGGSNSAQPLNKPIVGIVPTPTGHGYWLIGADGGIFAFGDAGYYGSCPAAGSGCQHLAAPIVAAISGVSGNGYLMIGADGGTFTFGPGAPFYGSVPGSGGLTPGTTAVGIALTSDGKGYWIAGSNCQVYAFGDASGSLTSQNPATGQCVGIADA
jgi:hypothetical protein